MITNMRRLCVFLFFKKDFKTDKNCNIIMFLYYNVYLLNVNVLKRMFGAKFVEVELFGRGITTISEGNVKG